MNNNRQQVFELDIKELMWRLLSQWKAILLASLLTALVVCSAKHVKDTKAYDNQVSSRNETEQQESLPDEDRIALILEQFSDEDRLAVQYVIQEKEWLAQQKEYVEKSLLMKTNPANQKVLRLVYGINSEDSSSLPVLLSGYKAFVLGERTTEAIKPMIDAEAESEYINELFFEDAKNSAGTSIEGDGAALNINIALPEETDPTAVASAMDDALRKQSNELQTKYPHSFVKASEEIGHYYHRENVEKRTSSINNVNNLENAVKTIEGTLSLEQKAAVDTIMSIKKDIKDADDLEANGESEEELIAPRFSKKYALLGFIIGSFIYAVAYVMHLILKEYITSSASVEGYTGSRLLGDIYYESEATGLKKLLHSKLVDKYHYRGRDNTETQIKKINDTIAAVCAHAKAKKVSLFKVEDSAPKGDDMATKMDMTINEVVESASKNGIEMNVIDIKDNVDEKELLSVSNSIIALENRTTLSSLSKLMSLCSDYDIKTLGAIYLAEK